MLLLLCYKYKCCIKYNNIQHREAPEQQMDDHIFTRTTQTPKGEEEVYLHDNKILSKLDFWSCPSVICMFKVFFQNYRSSFGLESLIIGR